MKTAIDSLPDRILEKIVVCPSGCWIWCGGVNNTGYGSTNLNNKVIVAHRAVYILLVGPIPAGMQLDHLCRVRNCVNPAHLEPVTSRENTMRGLNPEIAGGRQRAKTHCPHGHPYDANNTRLYTNPKGQLFRVCRACHSLYNQKHPRRRSAT